MESHNWGNKNKPKGLPGNFLVKLDQKEVWYSMLIPGKMDSESAHQNVAFTFQVSRGLKEKEGLNFFFWNMSQASFEQEVAIQCHI